MPPIFRKRKITLSASMEMAQSGSLWEEPFIQTEKQARTALGGGIAADFSETKNHSFCFNGNGAKRPRFGRSHFHYNPPTKKVNKKVVLFSPSFSHYPPPKKHLIHSRRSHLPFSSPCATMIPADRRNTPAVRAVPRPAMITPIAPAPIVKWI